MTLRHIRHLLSGNLEPEQKLFWGAVMSFAFASFAMGLNHLLSSTASSRALKSRDKRETLGTITPLGPDIKRKVYKTFEFSKVDSEQTLFQKDTIFAGLGSGALLDLRQYGTIKLSPNAVVLLTLDYDAAQAPAEKLSADGKSPASKSKNPAAHLQPKLHIKVEEGQVEYLKAEPVKSSVSNEPTQSVEHLSPAPAPVQIELGNKVTIEATNQKSMVVEAHHEGSEVNIISAEKPTEIHAAMHTDSGDTRRLNLAAGHAIKIDHDEKVEISPLPVVRAKEVSVMDKLSDFVPKVEVTQKPKPAPIRVAIVKPKPMRLPASLAKTTKLQELSIYRAPAQEVAPKPEAKVEPVAHESAEPSKWLMSVPNVSLKLNATKLNVADIGVARGAKLVSKYSYLLSFDWLWNLGSRLKLNLGFGVGSMQFEKLGSSVRTLQDGKNSTGQFHAGVGYTLLPAINLRAAVFDTKELFGRSLNSVTVTVDSLWIPSFNLGVDTSLWRSESRSMALLLDYFALASAKGSDFSAKFGSRYSAILQLNQMLSDSLNLGLDMGIAYRLQNSDLVTQKQSDVSGAVRFEFPLRDKHH